MKTLSTFVVMSLSLLTACGGDGAPPVSLEQTASPLAVTNGVSGTTCDSNAVPFGGGEGTAQSPYLICTPVQLLAINNEPTQSADYLVTSDLNLGTVNQAGALLAGFNGTFDGGGHTFTNFRVNSLSATNAGFVAENTGTLKNFILAGVVINGVTNVGAVAGINYGTINNVRVSGSVPSSNGGNNVGGVVGLNQGGTITNVQTDLVVVGNNGVGGIAGEFHGGVIANVTVTGSVSGNFDIGAGFGAIDIKVIDGGTGTGSVGSVLIQATFQGTSDVGCMQGFLTGPQPSEAGNSC
jgi:hypothetical protein